MNTCYSTLSNRQELYHCLLTQLNLTYKLLPSWTQLKIIRQGENDVLQLKTKSSFHTGLISLTLIHHFSMHQIEKF